MSATTREQVRPVARPLLRTFWKLHRAVYRLTRGRLGLQQPERGAKFGMLRLHTVGRRSGQARIAMVGYFRDGADLVTLAMNGWGKADPAWWLNLQANPAATVELADGSREVRARAAFGTERGRSRVDRFHHIQSPHMGMPAPHVRSDARDHAGKRIAGPAEGSR